jgi:predicted transposase YdaD
LFNWKISVEVTREFESQEEELLMALSQAYLEWEQQTEQRARQMGIQEGRQEGELALILRQITRRIGTIAPHQETQIRNLSLDQLE